jgi:hypothetical protein
MTCSNGRNLHATRLGLAFAASFAGSPVMAERQSLNSSSNCSNGRCTRVETRVIEDDLGGVRGRRRVEAWEERRGRSRRAERPAPWDPGRFGSPRRPGRDDD